MLEPGDPGPLPTYPTVKSGGLDSTQREGGALNKPIHFPSLSRSGEAAPTIITRWSKKITRGR